MNDEAPRASLLGIPGELRNRISRMVLMEDEAISITATENHKQPGFLRTCRQLRAEARDIFEKENDFGLEVLNCQPSIPLKYGLHWSSGLISHGHFTNTLKCKFSKASELCRMSCDCTNTTYLQEEWEKRDYTSNVVENEIDVGNVGWCFHVTMGSAILESGMGRHSRTKIAICKSEPRRSAEQLQNWMRIVMERMRDSSLMDAISANMHSS